jgi:hypothetical protein
MQTLNNLEINEVSFGMGGGGNHSGLPTAMDSCSKAVLGGAIGGGIGGASSGLFGVAFGMFGGVMGGMIGACSWRTWQ